MSFDAGALIFKIQTAGYQTFAQQMDAADRAVQQVGKAGADATPKVEKTGAAIDKTGKAAQSAKAPLDEQAKSTKKTGDESEKAAPKQEKQKDATERQAEAAKKLGAALTIAGVAVAALVTLSVAKWAEFDQAMSNTSAAVMATAQEQKDLSEAALEAGADTAYSASEAAAAEEELAKAGQSVADIVGGSLNGALALAAAGQLAVARSAEVMATTLTQFGLTADQSGHVADVLAAGAGKAQGSVDDLALALTYVGPLAKAAGWGLEETGGTLAYFASQGILGEKAGTSLRGVLAALQAPSAIAKKTMDEYGLSLYDANGKMISASQMAGRLKTAFTGLTDEERNAALGRIFGNESLTAATLLYRGGADAIDEWTESVDDSGYAAEQAAMRQDNLAGDVEKLGGAFDTALIRSGSGANDVLREMVQAVTALVDWYGELPAPVQATVLALGAATGAVALLTGGLVVARAKFIELKAQMDAANVSMGKTALVGGAASLVLAGVVTVVALLASAQAEARAKAEAYADTLEEGTNRVSKATRDMVKENLAAERSFLWMGQGSAYDNAEALGISLDLVTDAAMGSADAIRELQTKLEDSKARHDELGLSAQSASLFADRLADSVKGESSSLDEALRIAEQKNRVTGESADVSKTAAEAYLDEADAAGELESQLRDLIDTIMEANGQQQDAISSNAKWREALAGIKEQAEDAGTSLNRSTAAGAANAAALADVAASAQKASEDQYAVDLATMSATDAATRYAERLAEQRQAFIDSAIAAGYNADEVKALADEVFQLPSEKEIKFLAETATAQTDIDRFVYENSGREVILKIGTSRVAQGAGGAGGITQADGGIVTFHANGSVSENHVAQIARAGEYRVWAEPETDGESYVPHAVSKRARSEQIMAETAHILGGTYIPAGATVEAGSSETVTIHAPVTVQGGGLSAEEVRSIFRQEARAIFGSALGG